jgi:hypothetical protein
MRAIVLIFKESHGLKSPINKILEELETWETYPLTMHPFLMELSQGHTSLRDGNLQVS